MSGAFIRRVSHCLPNDVQVWSVDLDGYAGSVALEGLDVQEHARATRMAFPRDARRLLASRHALRRVLAGVLGRPRESLVFETGEFGKPGLVNGRPLHFNLSRSGPVAVIGVSSQLAVGVDIEVLRPVIDANTLARAHFTDEEFREWSRSDDPARDRTFLTIWTCKEACVKALGVGLSARPGSIHVGATARVRAAAVPLGEARCEVSVWPLPLPGEWVAAVAAAAPEAVEVALQFFRGSLTPPWVAPVEPARN